MSLDDNKIVTENLFGSQSVARGAYEAAVRLGIGCPGDPVTPAIEHLAGLRSSELKVEWAVSGKIALDVAVGHSLAGQRSFVSLNSAGLYSALDSLINLVRLGTKGGLVILAGDTVGQSGGNASSDSRLLAKLAGLPMLEPANPEQAHKFTRMAFELSEHFRIPVAIRLTSAIANFCAPVGTMTQERLKRKPLLEDGYLGSYLDLPFTSADVLAKNRKIAESLADLNKVYLGTSKVGVIATGSVWNYFLECVKAMKGFKPYSLRVAMQNPLPDARILKVLEKCERVLVAEELSTHIEERVRALASRIGHKVEILGKENGYFAQEGELDPDLFADGLNALTGQAKYSPPPQKHPARAYAAASCPGCPTSSALFALRHGLGSAGVNPEEAVVIGDYGCHTKGTLHHQSFCKTSLSPGSAISIAQGVFYSGLETPVVAVTGDQTFLRTGIQALIDAAGKNANLTVLVLNNACSASDGHQAGAGSGLDLAGLSKAARVSRAEEETPGKLPRLIKLIATAVKTPGVDVIVSGGECLGMKAQKPNPVKVFAERCIGWERCGAQCLAETFCQAIFMDEVTGKASIDQSLCNSCGLCQMVCKEKAIGKKAGLFGII